MKKNFCLSHGNYDLSKRWYIRYLDTNTKGVQVTKKVYGYINKHKTVEARINAANELIKELEKENNTPVLTSVRSQFLATLDEIKPTLRKKSYWTYYSKINNFSLWCEGNNIDSIEKINKKNVSMFLNGLLENKSNATYNAYKNTLYRLLPEGCTNAFDAKNLPKCAVPAKYFSENQKTKIRIHLSKNFPQLWLFCETIYFTLIRPGELRQIRINDINLENGTITVPANISKNKKTQSVAIPNDFIGTLLDMNLEQYPGNYFLFGSSGSPGPIARKIDTFAKLHQREIKQLGFDTERYKLYSWKHTGAVCMVLLGCSEKEIQIQGRWHSLDMLDKYLRQLGVENLLNVRSKHRM